MDTYSTANLPFGAGSAAGLGQQSNPWFTVANQFVPRNLHDVIKWARYIALQSPTTSEVIRKLATYPITEFDIPTDQEGLKKRYKQVIKSFKLKECLQDAGFEFFTIGNVFVSVYFPIQRDLVCKGCATSFNVKHAAWAKFKQYQFHGNCPKCGHGGILERRDFRSMNIEDMNFIKWTPEHIIVNHNPITGESEYFYKIPQSVKARVQKGDTLFINSLPWEFIDAIKNNQDFKFDRGSIFHLKNVSSGGSVEGIAIPPLLSLFSLVFYQATLRKANEAIANEYLNPLRVVHPAAQTGNSDPVIAMSLRGFKSNMEEALKIHKRDKNHILVAPTPVGYTTLGGEGKNLLVAQEIQQAEDTILLSLGVSRELLSGQTNWTSSSVGLRMMENLLTSYIGRLNDLIDWVMIKVSSYLNMEKLPISLVPFKLLDDDNFKSLLLQMSADGRASVSSLHRHLGMDYADELEKIKDESVMKAKYQIETQYETDQAHFLAAKELGKQMKGNEDYQNLLQKAQQIAEQLYGADEGARRSFLGQLKTGDYTMYLLVSKLLEEARNSPEHQQQVQQEAGGLAEQANNTMNGEGGQSQESQDPTQPQATQ